MCLMLPAAPVSRRLLLGRLGSGTGVVGTFLLSAALQQAMATAAHHAHAGPHNSTSPKTPATAPLVMLDPYGRSVDFLLDAEFLGDRFFVLGLLEVPDSNARQDAEHVAIVIIGGDH